MFAYLKGIKIPRKRWELWMQMAVGGNIVLSMAFANYGLFQARRNRGTSGIKRPHNPKDVVHSLVDQAVAAKRA
jgi:Mg2+ and Co2+ transporter CorA